MDTIAAYTTAYFDTNCLLNCEWVRHESKNKNAGPFWQKTIHKLTFKFYSWHHQLRVEFSIEYNKVRNFAKV